jgi:disulfide bond formation protein DsbB
MLASSYPRPAALLLAASAVALLYNAGLGIYHAGAEWKFWPGPETCAAAPQELSQTPGDLMRRLQNNRVTRCDEAALRIFGISLSGYSAAISTFLGCLSLFAIWRSKASPRKV